MIVNLDQLTNAMSKVKSFAQDTKMIPGILLNFKDNAIDVCYCDGRKAIIEKVDADMQAGEQLGPVIVPYQLFVEVVNACQPSGLLVCDDLEISVLENNRFNVKTVKYAIVAKPNGEDDYEEFKKPVSKFEQEIKYYRVDEDRRFGLLTRIDYDSIFSGELYDVWDRSSLQDVLKKLSKEDSKTCYCSSKEKAAFVVNVDHSIYIPKDELDEVGFSIVSKWAKYVVEILNKVSSDKVHVSVEGGTHCRIYTPDNKVGIWFEMAPGTAMDKMTIETYRQKDYGHYQVVFNRYALMDAVKKALAIDNLDSTSFTFKDSENGLVVSIVSGKGASKARDFSVIAEAYKDNAGDLIQTSIPVSLKALSVVVDNCDGAYLIMDVAVDNSGKCIRYTDVIGREDDGTPIAGALYYTLSVRK